MESLKADIKERMKKLRRLYYIYRELMKRREERKRFWKGAVKEFGEKHPEVGSLSDYKHALFRHRVSYDEYMHCYGIWTKNIVTNMFRKWKCVASIGKPFN